jgi:hypothetical protein
VPTLTSFSFSANYVLAAPGGGGGVKNDNSETGIIVGIVFSSIVVLIAIGTLIARARK